MEFVIALLLVAIVLAILARPLMSVVTVHDYERGLRYRQGRFSGLVDPGTHLAFRPFNEIRRMDARPTSITVPGTVGRNDVMAAATRCCSSTVHARESTITLAAAGTVLDVVPAVSTDGTTLVPAARSPSISSTHVEATAGFDVLLPTSAMTVNSAASSAMTSRLRSAEIGSDPLDTSTWSIPRPRSQSA